MWLWFKRGVDFAVSVFVVAMMFTLINYVNSQSTPCVMELKHLYLWKGDA